MKSFITKPVAVAAAAVLVALVAAAPAYCSGKTFGVRPGSIVQSAYFGFGSGAIMPLVGLDFLSVSASIEDEDLSASLFIPHAGIRMYLSPQNAVGNVRPYVEASMMYSISMVDLGDYGDLEDMAKEVLSFWGFTGIFGCEYYFSERFSVGGEYGIRYIRDSADLEGDVDEESVDSEITASYKRNYSGVVLSFHF